MWIYLKKHTKPTAIHNESERIKIPCTDILCIILLRVSSHWSFLYMGQQQQQQQKQSRERVKKAHTHWMNGMEHRFRTEYKQVIWRTGVIVTSWWVVGRKRRIETHQNLNQVALNKITNWFGCQCKQDQSVAFFIISIHHAGTHSFHITYFCVCGVRLLRWALTHLR